MEAILIRLDVAAFREEMEDLPLLRLASDESVLKVMHKARYLLSEIPPDLRAESGEWLKAEWLEAGGWSLDCV